MLRFLWREESGQGLIVGTLVMVMILGFAAMTVDVGLFLHERRELQKSADAAALAGAQELPSSPVDAELMAQEWADKNGIDASELEPILISTTHVANDTITVRVKRDVPFIFARVLGLTSDTMRADATALVGSPAGMSGLRPWAVLESALVSNPVVLKYDANNGSNGNFGALRIDGQGASTYEDTIINGSGNSLSAGSQPDTEPGNMVGGTRDGVQWLIDNTHWECDEFDEVFPLNLVVGGIYHFSNRCNPYGGATDSYRPIITPVINSFQQGSHPVDVITFAIFFIEGLGSCTGNHCEVTGRYVQANVDVGALIGALDPDGSIRFVRLVE